MIASSSKTLPSAVKKDEVIEKLPHIDDLLTVENLTKLAGSKTKDKISASVTNTNTKVKIPVELKAGGSSFTLTAEANIKLKLNIDIPAIVQAQKIKNPQDRITNIRKHIHLDSTLSDLKFN